MKFFNENTGLKYPKIQQTIGVILIIMIMTACILLVAFGIATI